MPDLAVFGVNDRVQYIEQTERKGDESWPKGFWNGTVLEVKASKFLVEWDAGVSGEPNSDWYDACQLRIHS